MYLLIERRIKPMAKYTRKCTNKYNRKAVVQFSMNGKKIKEWKTVGEVNRELGFDKSAILRCCKGKQKRSYWFVWKFKDDIINMNEHGSNVNKLSDLIQEVEEDNKS